MRHKDASRAAVERVQKVLRCGGRDTKDNVHVTRAGDEDASVDGGSVEWGVFGIQA